MNAYVFSKSSNRLYFFAAVIAAFMYGVLSGIRPMSTWAATHLLFDYEYGIVKRGLAGQVINLFAAPPHSYLFLLTVSASIFVAWVIVLLAIYYRSMRTQQDMAVILGLFFTSLGFIFLVHELGYLDHIGLLATLLCITIPASFRGVVARIIICCTMVMVHEAFFILFLPIIALDFLYSATLLDCSKMKIAGLSAAFLIPAFVLTWLAGDKLVAPVQADQINQYLASKAADFNIREGASVVLVRGGEDNLAIVGQLWNRTTRWIELILSLSVTVPMALFWLWMAVTLIKETITNDNFTRILLYVACATASFSPLILHILAWDLHRFNCLTQVTAFLVFTAIHFRSRTLEKPPAVVSNVPTLVLAAILIVNTSTEVPLLNEYEVQKPPFWKHFYHLRDYLKGASPFIVIP